MAEKIKIPEIRFKGFSEEWEERKYSKTFTKVTNNTLSRADLNYKSGLAKNVHYGDVLIKYGELLNVEKDKIPYITDDAVAHKLKSSKLQNGDIVIADAAEDEMVGKCTELINIGEEIIVSGLHTIPSRPMLSFASGYLGYFMNAPAYHTQLLRLMQGTKVLSISKAVLQDTAIIYPIDKEEQSQIGTLFSHLDHLITLRQRKYNKLVTIKKAMLEKMFPQNGARVPEIRFNGFTEEWEEKKYSKIFTKISNNTLSRAELNYNSGLAKNVHYGDVLIKYGEILDVEKDEIPYITNDTFANKFKSSKLQSGDVVIADAAEDETVGKCTELINVGEETVVSGLHTIPCRPILSFAIGYLGYFMNSPAYHTQLLRLMQGTKVLSISKTVLQDTRIIYPICKTEQSKIGNYFKNLDDLITLQKHELEKLKNIKKACLDKMFV